MRAGPGETLTHVPRSGGEAAFTFRRPSRWGVRRRGDGRWV